MTGVEVKVFKGIGRSMAVFGIVGQVRQPEKFEREEWSVDSMPLALIMRLSETLVSEVVDSHSNSPPKGICWTTTRLPRTSA